MECIHIHLISGASAVSLIPRPEDRTRLLSSSLKLFSGPPSSPSLFCTRQKMAGNRRLHYSLVSLGYLSSCSSSTPYVLHGRTQPVLFLVCCFNSEFDSTFLFEAPPLFAWVTLRARLCHIDDPQYQLPLIFTLHALGAWL